MCIYLLIDYILVLLYWYAKTEIRKGWDKVEISTFKNILYFIYQQCKKYFLPAQQ